MNNASSLVNGVDFVFVPARSFEAAEEFYGNVLGLPSSARYDKIPGGEFETGSLTLQVLEPEAIGRKFEPNKGAIALHVEDVEAARGELESKGVTFLGDTIDSGVCHMAIFEDPDGNTLILHHRYAPREP